MRRLTTVLPCRRTIRLSESIENNVQLVLLDSDTSIRNDKVKFYLFFSLSY